MWPALRSRENRLDFLAGALPPGVSHARASKAWGFNERGILTEYPEHAPVFDYDPSRVYNAFVDPGAAGGTIGGALPPGWWSSGSGVTATLVDRGTTVDGLPYYRIRVTGTTISTNGFYLSPCALANRECPIVAGEMFSAWARATLVAVDQPLGAMTVTVRLIENNDSFAVAGNTTLATLALGQPQTVQGTRTASNVNTTNGSIGIVLLGHTSGQAVDVTVEMVCPIVSRGPRPATDFATPFELAATDEHGRLYGRRGLLTEPPATNAVAGSRCEGAAAGDPGTLPTGWAESITPGLSRAVVGTGTEDGIPYVDVRISGTPSSGAFSFLYVNTSASPLNAAAGEQVTFSTFLRVVGGSLANTRLDIRVDGRDAGGTGVEFTSVNAGGVPTDALRQRRRMVSRTLTGGSTTHAVASVVLRGLTAGNAVDVTLRIGAPQLELGSIATSPIIAPSGAPAATPRARTEVSLASYAAAAMADAPERVCELAMELVPGTTGAIYWTHGPTFDDRELVQIGSDGRFSYQLWRAGAVSINAPFTAVGANARRFVSIATQQKRGAYKASYCAGTPTTWAQDAAINGVADVRLGRQNNSNQVAGWIRNFRWWADADDRTDVTWVGSAPDDGTGDTLRTALAKTQRAMEEAFSGAAAPVQQGSGEPTAALPVAAHYLDAGRALWWLSLAGADGAARWAPLGTIDHPGYIPGRWYGGNNYGVGSNHLLVPEMLFLTPQYIAHRVTISRLAFRTGNQADGSNVRLAIYSADPNTGEASDLIVEPVIDVAASSTSTTYEVALPTPVMLEPGIHWFGVITSGSVSFAGESHGGIGAGGPGFLRGGLNQNVQGILAQSRFGNTPCKTRTRGTIPYQAGAAFLPARLIDLIQAANTPASPYVSWLAA